MRNGGVKGQGFMGKKEEKSAKILTDLEEELILEDKRKNHYAFFMKKTCIRVRRRNHLRGYGTKP